MMFQGSMKYNDPFIRYRINPLLRLKPVTICIAAICDATTNPTILFCADRLVSAGIQFEGGSSKILQPTINCIVMETSNDSATSELVLEKFRHNLDRKKKYSIDELSNILSQECIKFRADVLDRQVVSRYNLAIEKLHAPPDSLLRDAVNELRIYPYPMFEFIVTGIDDIGAHIYTVDQDGNVKSWDFLGFTTIGSGGELAFSEMTKWTYSYQHPLSLSIPRIYFAKKASERAQGVGASTDYGFLTRIKKPDSEEIVPQTVFLSTMPEFIKSLDDAYQSIHNYEADTIVKIQKNIEEMQKNPPKQNTNEQFLIQFFRLLQ
jgi:hypothetical protein